MSILKRLYIENLRSYLVAACLTHDEVEGARTDLSKPPVPVQRNGNRDGRVISLESHTARDEKVVKLVNVEGLARFAKQERARLRNGPVGEAMTDRFDVVCP